MYWCMKRDGSAQVYVMTYNEASSNATNSFREVSRKFAKFLAKLREVSRNISALSLAESRDEISANHDFVRNLP